MVLEEKVGVVAAFTVYVQPALILLTLFLLIAVLVVVCVARRQLRAHDLSVLRGDKEEEKHALLRPELPTPPPEEDQTARSFNFSVCAAPQGYSFFNFEGKKQDNGPNATTVYANDPGAVKEPRSTMTGKLIRLKKGKTEASVDPYDFSVFSQLSDWTGLDIDNPTPPTVTSGGESGESGDSGESGQSVDPAPGKAPP